MLPAALPVITVDVDEPLEGPSEDHRQRNEPNWLTHGDRVLESFSFSDPKFLGFSSELAKSSLESLPPLPAPIVQAQLGTAVPETPVMHRRSSLALRSVRMGRKAISPYHNSYNLPVAPNTTIRKDSFETQMTDLQTHLKGSLHISRPILQPFTLSPPLVSDLTEEFEKWKGRHIAHCPIKTEVKKSQGRPQLPSRVAPWFWESERERKMGNTKDKEMLKLLGGLFKDVRERERETTRERLRSFQRQRRCTLG